MKKDLSAFKTGLLYSFIHFGVEVACFFFLFYRLKTTEFWWLFALAYDALAFVPQSFLGILSDKFPKFNMGFVGALAIAIALFIPENITALIILCLGNCLVHVDGAKHTLINTKAKLTPNALFVGGGSFGVVAGQLLAGLNIYPLIFIPFGLILCCVALTLIIHKFHSVEYNEEQHLPLNVHSNLNEFLFIFLIILAVMARSYLSYAVPISWNKTAWQTILLFSCMGIGKFLGGVFADKIGFKKTTLISLVFALPFLLFGNSVMVVSLIGVLLFSMTMPITVGILVSKFPRSPGFCFGITTIGLFLGMTPAFFITLDSLLTHQVIVFALTIVALISISICLKRKGKKC